MSRFREDPSLRPEQPLRQAPLEFAKGVVQETEHLRKKPSEWRKVSWLQIITGLIVCVLVGLFCMDPFLYAHEKSQAIPAYIYLNNDGMQSKAQALAESGMFTHDEIIEMNQRPTPAGVFDSLEAASTAADEVLGYMSGVNNLQAGRYDSLDPIGKVRCVLFVRLGFPPPVKWDQLNPTVGPETAVASTQSSGFSPTSVPGQISGATATMSSVTQSLKSANK